MPKRWRSSAVLLSLLLPACQKAGSVPAPTFAIAPQAASLTVEFAPRSAYRTNYLVPLNWDTAEGILTNSDPAIATSTVSVKASNSGSALSATLSFTNVKPTSGYTLKVELLNTQGTQPAIIASETQSAVSLTPGTNTLTLSEPQATPNIAPTQAFGPYVVSLPGFGTPGRLANAQDLVVDAKGRYLVLDNGRLRLIQPDALGRLSISTLAGQDSTSSLGTPGQGAAGFVDGPGETALFNNPRRLAIAPDGTVYVLDAGNNAIRKVVLDAKDHATVSTLAGNGAAGSQDGQGTSAEFNAPQGIAVDSQGNVYVADTGNNTIRMVTPSGAVSTIAGNGTAGFQDGVAASAEFNKPLALKVDNRGRIWVADTYNARLRLVAKDSNGGYQVSTAAGNGTGRDVDGTGTSAEFGGRMTDLAFTPDGSLDVLDNDLRHVTFDASGTATVSTLVSSALQDSNIVGLAAVDFGYPAMDVDASGNPLVLSTRTIISAAPDASGTAQLKTIFGDIQQIDHSDEDGPARFDYNFQPEDFAVDDANGDLYVTTWGNQVLRIPSGPGDPSPVLVAGSVAGHRDGPGISAEFNRPGPLTFGRDGALYVADMGDYSIRRIAKDASGQFVVSTYAGVPSGFPGGYLDGPAAHAKFAQPMFVTLGPDGALYVADFNNNMVRKIATDSQGQVIVSTVVGTTQAGFVDGPASIARISGPTGLAFDHAGNLIIADDRNLCIRKVTFDANGNASYVSTIAGSGQAGFQDGIGRAASFTDPHEVSIAANGDIYVIDEYRVRRISFDSQGEAVVATVAGADKGFADGPGPQARFGNLVGMMLDNQGNLLLADFDNWVIRKLVM